MRWTRNPRMEYRNELQDLEIVNIRSQRFIKMIN